MCPVLGGNINFPFHITETKRKLFEKVKMGGTVGLLLSMLLDRFPFILFTTAGVDCGGPFINRVAWAIILIMLFNEFNLFY